MLSFFSSDVLDEIWDLIESVFESFNIYSTVKGKKLFLDEQILSTGMPISKGGKAEKGIVSSPESTPFTLIYHTKYT